MLSNLKNTEIKKLRILKNNILYNNNMSYIMELPSAIKIKSYQNKKTYKANPPIDLLNVNNFNKLVNDKKNHEWIINCDIVKPYYDIDLGFKTEKEITDNYITIKNKWIKILNEIYDDAKIAISYCNRYKEKPSKTDIKNGIHYFISIHFIINNHYIKHGELEEYNKKLGLEQYEEYDKSVYSDGQNFRMINQSKPEKNNDVVVFKAETYKDISEIKYHIIQLTNDYDLSKMKYHQIEKDEISNNNNNDNDIMINTPREKADIKEIEKYLLELGEQKYTDCLALCLAVYNETEGNDEGKELLKKWFNKIYGTEDYEEIEYNYNNWKNNGREQKYTIGTIIHYYNQQVGHQNQTENIYSNIYNSTYKKEQDEDGDYIIIGKPNKSEMVEELNKKLIYNRETSEIIVLENNDVWYSKKVQALKELFLKYTFTDKKTKKEINPINIWMKDINRKEISKIDFDPSDNPDKNIFNIWKGFRINKNDCDNFDDKESEPLLNHIYKRWCNENINEYNYCLDYLAHLLQKPYIKMGVVLCLRSIKEGAGKGIVLNKLRDIIGNNHYFQCNNLNQLTSDFNGITEGKILINLDEAFWGKDKSKEGMLKNLITEETKLINKKNKEAYIINDYCNFILSTNNDCFIPATESGRRYYCLELSNELSGIQSEDKKIIIDEIRNVPSGAFAKILYNRDISNFNPREFTKTNLLQNQIEQNWNNIKTWWYDILKEERFTGKSLKDSYCLFGDIPISSTMDKDTEQYITYGIRKPIFKYDNNRHKIKNENGQFIIDGYKVYYDKDFLYNNYIETTNNGYKYSKQQFFEKFKNECIGDDLFKQTRNKTNKQKYYFQIKDIESYRKQFNEFEEYDYEYDDYDEISDDEYDSDDY